jgi:hypothetical protein
VKFLGSKTKTLCHVEKFINFSVFFGRRIMWLDVTGFHNHSSLNYLEDHHHLVTG